MPVVVGMKQRDLSVELKFMVDVNMFGRAVMLFTFKDTDGWLRGRRHQHRIKMRLDGDTLATATPEGRTSMSHTSTSIRPLLDMAFKWESKNGWINVQRRCAVRESE